MKIVNYNSNSSSSYNNGMNGEVVSLRLIRCVCNSIIEKEKE